MAVSSLRCAEGGSAPATECDPVPGNAYAAMASAIASATRTARSLSRGSTRTTPPAPRSPPRAALSLARERFAEKRASGSRSRPVVRRSCLRPEAIAGLARGVLLSMRWGTLDHRLGTSAPTRRGSTLPMRMFDPSALSASPPFGDPRAWRCASARARVRPRAAPRRLSRGSGRRCWSSGGDAAGPVPQRQ